MKTRAELIEFLEGELPCKLPGAKDRLDADVLSGPVGVRPRKVASKTISLYEAIGKTVDTNPSRPAMEAVYFDKENQVMVTTNGHYLICFPAAVNTTELINPRTKSVVSEKFPDYENVIPFNERISNTDALELYFQVCGIDRANRFLQGEDKIKCELTYDESFIYFSARQLSVCLKAMVESGTREIQIEFPFKHNRAVIFRDAELKTKFALCMPVMMLSDEDTRSNEVPGITTLPYCRIISARTRPVEVELKLAHRIKCLAANKVSWDVDYHTTKLKEKNLSEFSLEYHTEALAKAIQSQREREAELKAEIEELQEKLKEKLYEPIG